MNAELINGIILTGLAAIDLPECSDGVFEFFIMDTSGVNDTDDVPDFFIRNNSRLVVARNFQ